MKYLHQLQGVVVVLDMEQNLILFKKRNHHLLVRIYLEVIFLGKLIDIILLLLV
jgi:hypothetical protein